MSDVGGVALRGAGRFPQPWLGWGWWALAGVGGRWLALVGVGGRTTPVHPRKRPHFTPNPAKRPDWKRFGVKCREKSFEIPPF
ncbi:hypothetical protein L2141_08625, partial [Corynebacterium diphtheriae bv. mitis]|nr:hypothetical protein [Corynebacterium diphtheriae bv. mitis]